MKVPEGHSLYQVISKDPRFAPEAYTFVSLALTYANKVMDYGEQQGEREEHHVSGQELCEAIRQFALDQFGLMAKTVFNNWGIYETRDFGDIVYNLIEIEEFSKTDNDSVEDFNNVFDFDKDLVEQYKIDLPKDRFCK